jgi:thiol-disulfide isomerase/thioredoxin
MKIIVSFFLFIILLSLISSFVLAENVSDKVNVYFFWAEGCPHCANEKPFLESLKQKYSNLEVHSLEVTKSKENADLLARVGRELNADVSGVPFTVVGKQYFIGWYNEETTGKSIEEAVQCALKNACPDIVGSLTTSVTPSPQPKSEITAPEKITLPLLGEIETKNISLPIFTVIIGTLDGFNPCAMWVLLFLISMLLGMKNRKRMWILGITFLVASAFVYFLFMAAWLNLILFIGFIFWVRLLIALVALAGGIYNLREYFINKDSGCKVVGEEKRQKVFERVKRITHEQKFWLALVGIVILAASVNLVELICSAGLPVLFTQVLALNNLAVWQYYSYMLIYIFFFMLDDLIVFFIAMITLKLTGITTKYTRFSHLIGGIIMLIVGILLILKPELLMFG